MVQVLPQLNIKGACRVQHLSHVSIDGPNFTDNPENYPSLLNNKYVNMVFDVSEPKLTEEKPITPPLDSVKVITNPSKETQSFIGKKQHLKTSTTSTNSFGETSSEIRTTINSTSEGDAETFRSSSALGSTTTTLENTLPKTDDEKLKRTKKKRFTRNRILKSKTDLKEPVNAASNLSDPFSVSLMKMIDEIFESDIDDVPVPATVPVVAYSQTELSMLNDMCQHEHEFYEKTTVEEEPNVKAKHVINSSVQTRVCLLDKLPDSGRISSSTNNNITNFVNSNELVAEPSINVPSNAASINAKSSMAQSVESDVYPDEMIKSSSMVYELIRKRKAVLYEHHAPPFVLLNTTSNLSALQSKTLPTEENERGTPSSPITSSEKCHHRQHFKMALETSLQKVSNLAQKKHSETHAEPKEPPSVRLHNIRKLQHQQLVQRNPEIVRTLSSIQREVESSQTSNHHRSEYNNQDFRSKFDDNVIQEAARKILSSIVKSNSTLNVTKPLLYPDLESNCMLKSFPFTYSDDSVQLEAERYLRSVNANYELLDTFPNKLRSPLLMTESDMDNPSITTSIKSNLTSQSTRLNSAQMICTNSENSIGNEFISPKEGKVSILNSPLKNARNICKTPSAEEISKSSQISSVLIQEKNETLLIATDHKSSKPNSMMDQSTSSSIAKQMHLIGIRSNCSATSSLPSHSPIDATTEPTVASGDHSG